MQFDVYRNPIPTARRAYPFVVVLQSDFATVSVDAIVAPAAPRSGLKDLAGRLTPLVTIESSSHVVLVPALATVRRRDLGQCIASLAESRQDLLAAIDLLFFGV